LIEVFDADNLQIANKYHPIMKKLLSILALTITMSYCRAQDVSPGIIKSYHHIIELIKQDKAAELAALIKYPLAREKPLPGIQSAKQFTTYYPTIFDAAFKKKIALYNDSDIFDHEGEYGLVGGPFDGDIWMDENGRIIAINYSSKNEQEIKNTLTKQSQSKIYPAVNSWIRNIAVLRSKNLLIRIDETKNGLRYISWSHGRAVSEKPDIILYNGSAEAQGTQGGWTYTFKSGDWTYIVDDVEMAEKNSDLGYSLELLYNNASKSRVKLAEVK